jgi:hypothetical protein
VNQLTFQPVFNPSGLFVVIVHGSFPLLKQRIIHVAFGGRDYQFELLINAVVDVLAGIVIKNVVVDVLSAPKSSTATDLFPWVTLYIKAHRAVRAAVHDTLSKPTYAVEPDVLTAIPVIVAPPAV